MRTLIDKLFNRKKKETKKMDYEWEKFQKTAKEQFKILRDKGISIPIVTL